MCVRVIYMYIVCFNGLDFSFALIGYTVSVEVIV